MPGFHLIQVPYDAGVRDRRMGLGPEAILAAGTLERLRSCPGPIDQVVLGHDEPFEIELAITFALQRRVAQEVDAALRKEAFPLVLSGACNVTVGAMAAFGQRKLGLMWFDSHADMHTPDTTTSGFIDGMALTMLTGRSWRGMTATLPSFDPLPDESLALIGVRDVDEPERQLLDATPITWIGAGPIKRDGAEAALSPVVDNWSQMDGVYVHLDLDVIDPESARINPYQANDGITVEEVADCLRTAASRFPVVGATVSAYDPSCDPERSGAAAAVELIGLLGELANSARG